MKTYTKSCTFKPARPRSERRKEIETRHEMEKKARGSQSSTSNLEGPVPEESPSPVSE